MGEARKKETLQEAGSEMNVLRKVGKLAAARVPCRPANSRCFSGIHAPAPAGSTGGDRRRMAEHTCMASGNAFQLRGFSSPANSNSAELDALPDAIKRMLSLENASQVPLNSLSCSSVVR